MSSNITSILLNVIYGARTSLSCSSVCFVNFLHFVLIYWFLFFRMDFSSNDEALVDAPVNPDLPKFLVIPPRLWMGKTVFLHNDSGLLIAERLVRNLRSSAIVGSSGPLSDSQVVVQVSTTFVEEEVPDELRYSFKSWPIQQLLLDGVNFYHHSQHDAYNTWMTKRMRPLDGRTRSYDNSSRNSPAVVSREC